MNWFDKLHDYFIDLSRVKKFAIILGIIYFIGMIVFGIIFFLGDDSEQDENVEEESDSNVVSIGKDESKFKTGVSGNKDTSHSTSKIVDGQLITESDFDDDDLEAIQEYVSNFEIYKTSDNDFSNENKKSYTEGDLKTMVYTYVMLKYQRIGDYEDEELPKDKRQNLEIAFNDYETKAKETLVKSIADDFIKNVIYDNDKLAKINTDVRYFKLETDDDLSQVDFAKGILRYRYNVTPLYREQDVKEESGIVNAEVTFVRVDGEMRISEVRELKRDE